jgi:iron complex outermembrane receptor protein
MTKETVISRSLRLMFSGTVAFGAIAGAHAQTAPEAPIARVEITGSSIKRAQVEGALPVQTVSREDIAKTGATSTEALLASITANTAVGGTVSAQGAGASTYGLAAASLRGLGSNKTLVLVNGRRLANFATDGTSVDINSIPLAAVDHVEILKDGASGVYGSDAIGGVINFILRNNYNGVEVTGYGSGTKDGGGRNTKASILAGFGDYDEDRYNFTVSADVGKEQAIYGSQRGYARESWNNNGLRDASATPSGNLSTFNPTTTPNANGVIPNSLASLGSGLGNPLNGGDCTTNGSQFDANTGSCRFNSAGAVPLFPDVTRANVSANFRFKLNEQNEFFIEGFHSEQKTTTNEQSSPYSASFLSTDNAFATANVYPAIILSPSSPYYPASYLAANYPTVNGQPVTVSYRAFDGGGRSHDDHAKMSHLVMGFRGTVKGYDYDVAYTHNSSNVSEDTISGYQSQLALVKLLSNNNAFNPFAATQSPALAQQIYATNYVGNMINSTLSNDSLNARISGDLYQLPAGMAKFAVGASMTDEKLDLNPSAAYQSGDISGYGGQTLPLSASRNSSAIFAELNAPILKNLEADLAVRTDRYPNATATNPKVSFRYQPLQQVLVRASYGRGFREAALPELNNPQTLGTSASFTDPKTNTFGQFNVLAGGNPNLKPEKSEQTSVGFVIDPIPGASIAIDYWKINVNNLVTSLTPEFIVDHEDVPAYGALVQRDSAGNITQITSTNLNAGGLKTAGIDLDARWTIAKTANYGTFATRLNGTYVTKYDMTLPDGTVQQSVARTVDETGSPLNAVGNGGIILRWKHQLAFDWKYQNWGVNLTQNFQSGYHDATRADEDLEKSVTPVRVGAFSTWDSQVSYTGVKNLTVRVGVKNLFNRQPPEIIGLGNYFQAGYDPTYYDAHGATGYVSASYKF